MAKNICHIYLYGDIVNYQAEDIEYYGCVSLTTIKNAYQQNPNCDEVVVHINSCGGNVLEGFAIYDFLMTIGKPITTIIEGLCASIATVPFLAGSIRKITENSQFLIHNPWCWVEGTADDLQEVAAALLDDQQKMLDFYVAKTGGDADVIQAYMDEDKLIDAATALEWKFATEIVDTVKAMSRHHQREILNSIHKSKTNKMEKTKKDKLNGFIASMKKLVNEVKAAFDPEENTPQAGSVKLAADAGDLFFEGDTIAVGTAVFTDAEMTVAAADGDYEGDNGDTITVKDGAVEAIVEAVAEDETDAEKIARLESELATANAAATENETLATNAMTSLEEAQTVLASVRSSWTPPARNQATPKGKAAKTDPSKVDLKAAMAEEKRKRAEAKAKK